MAADRRGSPASVGLRWRGRARPGGWRRLDPFLNQELRGGRGWGVMHGRLHPASISTRAAATPEELKPHPWSTSPSSAGGAWVAEMAGSVQLSRCRPSTRDTSPRVLTYILSRCHTHSLFRPLTHVLVAGYLGTMRLAQFGQRQHNMQSFCSSSSRPAKHGRGDPGHGPSPFRSMSIISSTRK